MIYLLKNNGYLKIGYAQSIYNRMKCYNTYAFGYQLLQIREGNRMLEKLLHKAFSKYAISIEWFIDNDYIIQHFKDSEQELSTLVKENILNRVQLNVWTQQGKFYKTFINIDECARDLQIPCTELICKLSRKKRKIKNFIVQPKIRKDIALTQFNI